MSSLHQYLAIVLCFYQVIKTQFLTNQYIHFIMTVLIITDSSLQLATPCIYIDVIFYEACNFPTNTY